MRILAVAAVVMAALTLAGCYVQSVCPLYSTDKLTFDPGLVGTWVDPEEPDETITCAAAGDSAYTISVVGKGATEEIVGHLVQLGETVYLDMFPSQATIKACGGDFIPLHNIIIIQRDGDDLKTMSMDFAWLDKKIGDNELDISHFRYDGRIVLSAETDELQRAVTGFTWKEEDSPVYRRVK